MESSGTRAFLTALASKNAIALDRVEGVISLLEDNWYDTVESLGELTELQWRELKVPSRIIELVKKELQKKSSTEEDSRHETLIKLAAELSESPGVLRDCVSTLQLIFFNILKTNPIDDRVRRLKMSNQQFYGKVAKHHIVQRYLERCGFAKDAELFYMETPHFPQLYEILAELNEVAEQLGLTQRIPPPKQPEPTFDPYKVHISNINPDQIPLSTQAHDPIQIIQEIQTLEYERDQKTLSQGIERNPRIFRPQEAASSPSLPEGVSTSEEDNKLYLGHMKQILAERDAMSTFKNKRKGLLERMKTTQSPTRLCIRVRFPDTTILEGHFSVLETNLDVYKFVAQHLAQQPRKFELFLAPPRQLLRPTRVDLKPLSPASILNFSWKSLEQTTAAHGPFLLN